MTRAERLEATARRIGDAILLLEQEDIMPGHPIHHMLVNAQVVVSGTAFLMRRDDERQTPKV